jgi:hypothetical protein
MPEAALSPPAMWQNVYVIVGEEIGPRVDKCF